jgi:hypothetical protein
MRYFPSSPKGICRYPQTGPVARWRGPLPQGCGQAGQAGKSISLPKASAQIRADPYSSVSAVRRKPGPTDRQPHHDCLGGLDRSADLTPASTDTARFP